MEAKQILLIIVIVLLVLQYSKWIIFFILSPLYRRAKKRSKAKWIYTKMKFYQQDNKELVEKAPTSNIQIKENVLKRILSPFFKWMGSFSKYMDFQIGALGCLWLRRFIYKHIFCVDLSDNAIIHIGTEIRAHEKLILKKGAIVGDFCLLDARNGIVMEENSSLGSHVQIYTEQHDHRDPDFACNSTPNFRVTIGKRAWIGPGVIILPGVKIGEGAVVGAGAVVTKDIPDFSIAVGIPAKVIGKRNPKIHYEFNNKGIMFC